MPNDEKLPAGGVTWQRPTEAVALILRGVTFPTAWRVALIVGTIITMVNQLEVLIRGDQTAMTWVRIACNYLIPYVVTSIGYLAPLRRRATDPAGSEA